MADEVTLLNCWASVSGMRCRIALAEKGIQYEYKEEDMFNKSPLLLQSNPIHKIPPVLIHNGKPICGATIIVEYIDETWKEKAPLMPSDPYGRSEARFWSNFLDNKISFLGYTIWTRKGEEQETGKRDFLLCLKVLETRLGNDSFFGGEAFGFLDLTIVPYYAWLHSFEKFGKFNIESKCPKFIAWAKRCLERETVIKIIPNSEEVYNFLLMFKDRLGKTLNDDHSE